MPITIYPTTFKYKDNNGQYQSVNAIKGDPGEVTLSSYRVVADVTLSNDVPYNNAYNIDLSDYPANEIFLYINIKASTETTSLRFEIYNSDNLIIFSDNYNRGITTEEQTRLWQFEIAGDYAVMSMNTNNSMSQTTRALVTLKSGRKHDGIYRISIRPYNGDANIPTGSVIRLFAK